MSDKHLLKAAVPFFSTCPDGNRMIAATCFRREVLQHLFDAEISGCGNIFCASAASLRRLLLRACFCQIPLLKDPKVEAVIALCF